MTEYAPGKAPAEVERYNALNEMLWNYTVEENDARLDALPPTSKHIIEELKMIEGILIALRKA